MAKIEDIEIHTGKVDFAFKPIRRLEVKCEASNALMPAPTIEEANGRLRALAAKVGANAIVDANYDSGISLTSWKSLKATGMAVVKESDEQICPVCAETIKRAAVKCRYCNAAIEPPAIDTIEPRSVEEPSDGSSRHAAPLTDNNNPAIVIGLIFLAAFVLLLVIGAGR